MPAPTKHPSGKAKMITLYLAPDPLQKLTALCEDRGMSRGEVITKLLERVADPREQVVG